MAKGYTKDKFTKASILKTPLKLQGAKNGTRDYIYKFFPEHKYYIELFMGSNTVQIGKPEAEIEFVVDVNAYAINFFEILQDRPEEFWAVYQAALKQFLEAETRGEHKEYFNSYKHSVVRTRCPLMRAAYFYLITKACFNGIWRLNESGECNSAFSKAVKGRGWLTRPWFDEVLKRIAQTEFECEDYKVLLAYASNPNTFIFLDPPYEFRSKKLPKGTVTTYNGIKFLEADFREMQALLAKTPCQWLMTVSDTPLMRELFKDNYIVPWEVYYCSSEKSSSRGKKPELLIANYDIVSINERLKLEYPHLVS